MARIAWNFYDPSTSDSYDWVINPNEADSPQYTKNIYQTSSSGPDGNTILMEGKDEVKTMSFSGIVLTEAQYNEMITWFTKRNQIQITDDLGRTFDIYIRSFQPKRVRSNNYPWRHTYTVEVIVLDLD